ncbi:MAG: beta-ketoacyl-ACP synthase II [Planctomycetes bacterium]|nr:beta-ketoacyl-ACP synthase II [Planctomycetota bacterium]
MRRVVITGLGTVNALGLDVKECWPKFLAGENGITPITKFDASGHTAQIEGAVKWDQSEYFSGSDARKLDPFTMFALVATQEALSDAGLGDVRELPEEARERFGAVLGTGIGGITGILDQEGIFQDRGPRRVSPHFVPRIMANAVSGQVAIAHGLLGTVFTTSSACASSGHAIGVAFQSIRYGESDVVITGGAESSTTPLALAGFCSAKAVSTRNESPELASRPFDKERDGFVMGEGCGILILEEYEHAKARGATIYAEMKGYGSTDDAFHITAPQEDGGGPSRAMTLALKQGGVDVDAVDYINAHGTSTPYNDAIETRAIRKTFGAHADALMVSSTKSMIGHCLGASSAVELVATALSVHHGAVHPTRNYQTPDPDCDLDYVPGEAREVVVRNALSNSLGFGGHNVSLLIGQAD